MTLAEAAHLFWPQGPLSERTLRTAARDGRLPISRVAGKFFVTKTAIGLLSVCASLRDDEPPVATGGSWLDDDLAAIRRMD